MEEPLDDDFSETSRHEEDLSSALRRSSSQQYSNGGGGKKCDDTENEPAVLTKNETRAVNRSKLIVYLAILVAAAGVGAATYALLSNEQTKTFHNEFHSTAREVANQANLKAKTLLGQLQVLSTALTSQALHDDANTWPNVTLLDYNRRIQDLQRLTGVHFVAFCPVVPLEATESYQAYTDSHQYWIDNDLESSSARHHDHVEEWDDNELPAEISEELFAYDQATFVVVEGAAHTSHHDDTNHHQEEEHDVHDSNHHEGQGHHKQEEGQGHRDAHDDSQHSSNHLDDEDDHEDENQEQYSSHEDQHHHVDEHGDNANHEASSSSQQHDDEGHHQGEDKGGHHHDNHGVEEQQQSSPPPQSSDQHKSQVNQTRTGDKEIMGSDDRRLLRRAQQVDAHDDHVDGDDAGHTDSHTQGEHSGHDDHDGSSSHAEDSHSGHDDQHDSHATEDDHHSDHDDHGSSSHGGGDDHSGHDDHGGHDDHSGHDDHDHHNHGPVTYSIPVWQVAPVLSPRIKAVINLNLFTHPDLEHVLFDAVDVGHPLFAQRYDDRFWLNFMDEGDDHMTTKQREEEPRAQIIQPVFESFDDDAPVRGLILAAVSWNVFLRDILAGSAGPIMVHVHETCNEGFAYRVHGVNATFQGYGQPEQFDSEYAAQHLQDVLPFADFTVVKIEGHGDEYMGAGGHCRSTLVLRPTTEMEKTFQNHMPLTYTVIVVLVFVFTALVFLVYDFLVQRRQTVLLSTAQRTNAIVASLFPKNVQSRIMHEAEEKARQEAAAATSLPRLRAVASNAGLLSHPPKSRMQSFLDEGEADEGLEEIFSTKPIADLFPEATIIFADLVGFTAWSSTREPEHVFMLLESIYHAFDSIAKKRRIFKVETVGDCYVAVAGLPEARRDHATAMARFARECLLKFGSLVKELELKLGPDTADLAVRIGLHSGPVTAGVLRGEKARFQLFGDTMNTTSRIETTGRPGRIHLSQETAELLASTGKAHWIVPREQKVTAKGKGELTTFWLRTGASSHAGTASSDSDVRPTDLAESAGTIGLQQSDAAAVKRLSASSVSGSVSAGANQVYLNPPTHQASQSGPVAITSDKYHRLVRWNAQIVSRLLREIQAARKLHPDSADNSEDIDALELQRRDHPGRVPMDEMKETIDLQCDGFSTMVEDPEDVALPEEVSDQVVEYCQTISAMYRSNPFHNFEHASHVTMSVVKLLSRISSATELPRVTTNGMDETQAQAEYTRGITSDPVTQLAVVLCAMTHDIDHPGVPNAQLAKENTILATAYRNKSLAEQQAVDLAWDLLMDESFSALRRAIYRNPTEYRRFRQVFVNCLLATDVMDKDLGNLRKARWNRAFVSGAAVEEDTRTSTNRKATIVIEHLIQASDVAHTMQHFLVYRKWNARLFEECMQAYDSGRAERNPSDNWYTGELAFFDLYVIPLAKKLKECGVFGVSSDEYLNYAQRNRREWERVGREAVAEMVEAHYRNSQAEIESSPQIIRVSL